MLVGVTSIFNKLVYNTVKENNLVNYKYKLFCVPPSGGGGGGGATGSIKL